MVICVVRTPCFILACTSFTFPFETECFLGGHLSAPYFAQNNYLTRLLFALVVPVEKRPRATLSLLSRWIRACSRYRITPRNDIPPKIKRVNILQYKRKSREPVLGCKFNAELSDIHTVYQIRTNTPPHPPDLQALRI